MEKFFSVVGVVVFAFVVLVFLSVLGAYPTKWVVNYLFAPALVTFFFGVAKLTFWRALALNFVTATLFKSTNTVKA